jgi:roadblock/LC7 domain-containing protein
MANLDQLLSIKGVWAAGEFSQDGKLLAYKGNISEEEAAMGAMMCAANKLMGNMQAKGWSTYTGKDGFYPVEGFAVAGGKYVACIFGNVGVFLELSKADFDKTFEVLSKYI